MGWRLSSTTFVFFLSSFFGSRWFFLCVVVLCRTSLGWVQRISCGQYGLGYSLPHACWTPWTCWCCQTWNSGIWTQCIEESPSDKNAMCDISTISFFVLFLYSVWWIVNCQMEIGYNKAFPVCLTIIVQSVIVDTKISSPFGLWVPLFSSLFVISHMRKTI